MTDSVEEGNCKDSGCSEEFDGKGKCVNFSTYDDFKNLARKYNLSAEQKPGLCGHRNMKDTHCCHCMQAMEETEDDSIETSSEEDDYIEAYDKSDDEDDAKPFRSTKFVPQIFNRLKTLSEEDDYMEAYDKSDDEDDAKPIWSKKIVPQILDRLKTSSEPDQKKKPYQIISIGGDTEKGATASTEEDNLQGPKFGDLPAPRWGHVAAVVEDNNGRKHILVCGGKGKDHGPELARDCIEYKASSKSPWIFHSTLELPRISSSSVTMSNGDVYILGGSYSPTTSELLDMSSPLSWSPAASWRRARNAWRTGPQLPFPLLDGCATTVDSKNFVILGGGLEHNQVSVYNTKTRSWSEKPNLKESRRGHSCANLGDKKIIVAGGFSYKTFAYTSSTLVVDLRTGKATNGGNMKIARAHFSMDVFGSLVFAVGGVTNSGYTSTIELKSCNTPWHVSRTLATARSSFATVMVDTKAATARTEKKKVMNMNRNMNRNKNKNKNKNKNWNWNKNRNNNRNRNRNGNRNKNKNSAQEHGKLLVGNDYNY